MGVLRKKVKKGKRNYAGKGGRILPAQIRLEKNGKEEKGNAAMNVGGSKKGRLIKTASLGGKRCRAETLLTL